MEEEAAEEAGEEEEKEGAEVVVVEAGEEEGVGSQTPEPRRSCSCSYPCSYSCKHWRLVEPQLMPQGDNIVTYRYTYTLPTSRCSCPRADSRVNLQGLPSTPSSWPCCATGLCA